MIIITKATIKLFLMKRSKMYHNGETRSNQAVFMGKATKLTIVEINQSTKAPIQAGIKPTTSKPGTIKAVILIKKALITNVKSPKVRILIGKVKITITGFMKALMIPKTSATIKAVTKELTLNPGRYWEIRRIVKAERIQFAKIAIFKVEYITILELERSVN